MSSLSRVLCTAFAVLLIAGLNTGCQTTATKKTAPAPKDTVLPPPPPPSWETPGKPTAFTPAAQSSMKLTPKMEVTWTIISDQQKYMTGPSTVGPDGTVVIGPYGSFQVGGMTVAQASMVIEKGIRQHLPNSRVQLQLAAGAMPAAHAPGTTWSSTGSASNGIKSANYTSPDWSASDKAAAPCPHCAAAAAATTTPVTPNVLPDPAPTPTQSNKRGPLMTWMLGPRY